MKDLLIVTIAVLLFGITASAEPIHDAILDGDLEEVQKQLNVGVDVDKQDTRGYTPLHYAAGVGRSDIVELLIKNGADINATDGVKGATPLDYAYWKNQMNIVETLKKLDAQRTYGDKGKGDGNAKSDILKITNIGDGNVMVEFKTGVLQVADSIDGPWEDLNEESPVTWSVGKLSMFARLKISKGGK